MKKVRDLLTVCILIAQPIYIAIVWATLPAMLPSHFALDGTPNRYAPKAILWFLIAIQVVVVLLLTTLERHPRLYNLPSRVGDPDREREETIARNMLGWMRIELVILFAYILWSIVNTAQHCTNGLGSGFILIFVAVIAATSIYFLLRMKKC